MAPLGEGAAPMLHVGIRQQEPYGLGLRRAIDAAAVACAARGLRAAARRPQHDRHRGLAVDLAGDRSRPREEDLRALDVHSVHELSARIHRQVAARVA